jgi:hypothetical protein
MFLQDNCVLSCRGVFVDTVDSLGAEPVPREEGAYRCSPIQYESDGRAEPPPVVDEDERLTLARVLCTNSDYEFSDGPSLLDVPRSYLKEMGDLYFDKRQDNVGVEAAIRLSVANDLWRNVAQITPLRFLAALVLHPNADFKLSGRPLKDYFNSTEERCTDPEAFVQMTMSAIALMSHRRLSPRAAAWWDAGRSLLG